MTTLYGIKNCDSVKKARRWLEKNDVEYHFHDFRSDGITRDQVKTWIAKLGLEQLLNKRSSTWKALAEPLKAKLDKKLDEKSAVGTILDYPTLIKRPLLNIGAHYCVGFSEDKYKQLLM